MTMTTRPLRTIKFIGLSETNTIGYYEALQAARHHQTTAEFKEHYAPPTSLPPNSLVCQGWRVDIAPVQMDRSAAASPVRSATRA